MEKALKQLPDDVDLLKSLVADQLALNEQLSEQNQRYKAQVLSLQEQLNLALARRYAASSEKISRINTACSMKPRLTPRWSGKMTRSSCRHTPAKKGVARNFPRPCRVWMLFTN